MKVGCGVKLNIDKLKENYTKALMSSELPDYNFIVWAEKNRLETFKIERVIYGNIIKLEGIERFFYIDELYEI